MSDFDYHCGMCGAITVCSTHGGWQADCRGRGGCKEQCSRDASHDVNEEEEIP